ncbi:C-3 sterol dehydrogenase/C-4 decarboxylase family protein [Astrocystis sublimbata]|nr:C-3 sterol dehydrogenase/C-4 decarboxylase family protein [Astrocystis sublimbata]
MPSNTNSLPTLGPVIVTGGCGFIGSHIVDQLLEIEPDCQVHVIDINTSQNRVAGVTYHTCDISSVLDVNAVFAAAKPKTIFHVACPDSMVQQPAVFRRVNVDGAQNLLNACRQQSRTVQAFVNTSTSSVIHDNLSDLFDADETFPVLQYPAQKRVYTLTKAEAEADILAANRESGDSSLLTVSLRPATAFGERDTVTMGKIVANVRAGKEKIQIGPGKNIYDFVYISNLVDAHILAAQALVQAYGRPAPTPDMRVDGEVFNITNEEPVEFWDFQRSIAASVGLHVKKEDIRIVPIWIAMVIAAITEWLYWIFTLDKKHPIVTREAIHLTTISRTLSNAKARRVLGYVPRVSMESGLAKAGKWFIKEAETASGSRKSM